MVRIRVPLSGAGSVRPHRGEAFLTIAAVLSRRQKSQELKGIQVVE